MSGTYKVIMFRVGRSSPAWILSIARAFPLFRLALLLLRAPAELSPAVAGSSWPLGNISTL